MQIGDVRGQVNGVHDLGTLFSTINLPIGDVKYNCLATHSKGVKKKRNMNCVFHFLSLQNNKCMVGQTRVKKQRENLSNALILIMFLVLLLVIWRVPETKFGENEAVRVPVSSSQILQ